MQTNTPFEKILAENERDNPINFSLKYIMWLETSVVYTKHDISNKKQ